MKIVLLQDEIYLPSFGGGTKANRYLLEALALNGHECLAITRALTQSADGPNDMQQFVAEMNKRGTQVHETRPEVYAYQYGQVQVESTNFESSDEQRDYLSDRILQIEPDWVFVTDDKRRLMLQTALMAAPDRVILLLQTIIQLPFGPLSVDIDPEYTGMLKAARAVVVISDFMKNYMLEYGDISSHLLPMPVYGKAPYPDLGCFEHGYVTMINPCKLKGVDIFLALAHQFPDVQFAAVPTWGADQDLIKRLHKQPNIRLLKPAEDIENILSRTRILLVPSLWPETFGYVVPEAMLRGIPVLASDIGGLPEAKLGVDYLLPVKAGEFGKDGFVCRAQDILPWSDALEVLLRDRDSYQACSKQSRLAAHEFVADLSVSRFEVLMEKLADGD